MDLLYKRKHATVLMKRRNRTKDFQKSIVVPYVPSLEKLKYPLKELNTNLIFKYNNKLGQNLTDNKPKLNKTEGMYKIPCRDWKQFYVGETERDLITAINEHKHDIKTECKIAEHVRK